MIRRFIVWAVRRTNYSSRYRVVSFTGAPLFKRFAFLWPDEFVTDYGQHFDRPPWYRPFNVLLHCWQHPHGSSEGFHDHPRWSVTVCLKGKIVERTPWGERKLVPGSVVFRSRKTIHAFSIPNGYAGKTWTLFLVGRRNHQQHNFSIASY